MTVTSEQLLGQMVDGHGVEPRESFTGIVKSTGKSCGEMIVCGRTELRRQYRG